MIRVRGLSTSFVLGLCIQGRIQKKISEGVLGTSRRRRRDRDAEGVEGVGNGERVSPSPAD